MANIKQQLKRIIIDRKKKDLNAAFKSSLKTAIKDLETAVAAKDAAKAKEAYEFACKKLDKSASKGIHHKNYVARQKSRLAKLVNTLAA